MAQRVHDLAVHVRDDYDGDAARVWTDAADADELRANLAALPGFGEMKIKALGAVLAKRFGVEAAEELVPWHPTLGDVDSRAGARRLPGGQARAQGRVVEGPPVADAPAITYPDELPVSARRDDLLAAIGDHQVVVVAGETGSGKTTQLPKLCLELGRGRVDRPHAAAADRGADASPSGSPRSSEVAARRRRSATRCASTTARGADTLVRLMTDGLLLAEIQRDRLLRRYDTIIVDEAHERSLNIDFLLGYLHAHPAAAARPQADHHARRRSTPSASPRTSAARRSSRSAGARTRSRSATAPPDDATHDELDAIGDAVGELLREGPGDVLVFLTGEREIRDAADALRGRFATTLEVLPLYARLSTRRAAQVFRPRHAHGASCSPRTSPRRR